MAVGVPGHVAVFVVCPWSFRSVSVVPPDVGAILEVSAGTFSTNVATGTTLVASISGGTGTIGLGGLVAVDAGAFVTMVAGPDAGSVVTFGKMNVGEQPLAGADGFTNVSMAYAAGTYYLAYSLNGSCSMKTYDTSFNLVGSVATYTPCDSARVAAVGGNDFFLVTHDPTTLKLSINGGTGTPVPSALPLSFVPFAVGPQTYRLLSIDSTTNTIKVAYYGGLGTSPTLPTLGPNGPPQNLDAVADDLTSGRWAFIYDDGNGHVIAQHFCM
jgi:hypothetical protein